MGVPPVSVDIRSEIEGITFGVAWKNRVTLVVDDATGLAAHFISRDDLIVAKLAAGRLRDLADADALQKTARSTKQPPASDAATRSGTQRKRSKRRQ
jgi:hypothetical protein